MLRWSMIATFIQNYLESLHAWILVHPQSSVFAFAGIFVVFQLAMVPVAPLGMAAGFFFGYWKGFVTLMFGCALGASLNFFLVRWVLHDFVQRKLKNNRAFQMINIAVAREGWRIVALLRFVPIPFGLANYCYGLTPIPFWPYLAATCVAIIPADSLFVWIGGSFHGDLSTLITQRSPLDYVLMGVGVIAALLVLRIVAKTAKAVVERDAKLGLPTADEEKAPEPHDSRKD